MNVGNRNDGDVLKPKGCYPRGIEMMVLLSPVLDDGDGDPVVECRYRETVADTSAGRLAARQASRSLRRPGHIHHRERECRSRSLGFFGARFRKGWRRGFRPNSNQIRPRSPEY
ncbi:CheY-like two-component responsive regulatorfamily protein, partial [Striga asiatica]